MYGSCSSTFDLVRYVRRALIMRIPAPAVPETSRVTEDVRATGFVASIADHPGDYKVVGEGSLSPRQDAERVAKWLRRGRPSW